MIPASVPVPIRSTETPITLLRPNSEYSLRCLILPVASVQITPPNGSAISGSTAILKSGHLKNI